MDLLYKNEKDDICEIHWVYYFYWKLNFKLKDPDHIFRQQYKVLLRLIKGIYNQKKCLYQTNCS